MSQAGQPAREAKVETDTRSRDTDSQGRDGRPPSPPYPLARGDIGVWLRRGEQLGRAAWWIAATVAAGHKRAAKWRRHVASKGPIDSPPQPG
jgi:hypothetical protein